MVFDVELLANEKAPGFLARLAAFLVSSTGITAILFVVAGGVMIAIVSHLDKKDQERGKVSRRQKKQR